MAKKHKLAKDTDLAAKFFSDITEITGTTVNNVIENKPTKNNDTEDVTVEIITEEITTEVQAEEESSQVQAGEESSQVQAEEESSEVQVEEESSQVQAEEESFQVQVEEESSQVQVEEESSQVQAEEESSEVQVEEESSEVQNSNKNLGGRPKKIGLKNEQFTLTMDPEKYEKLRIIASEQTRGNFSALIDDAIRIYCQSMNIDLSTITVDEDILAFYRNKQERKSKRARKK